MQGGWMAMFEFFLFASDQGKRPGAVQVPGVGGVAAFPVRFARFCVGSLFGSGAESQGGS